jgi:hypothetical protein
VYHVGFIVLKQCLFVTLRMRLQVVAKPAKADSMTNSREVTHSMTKGYLINRGTSKYKVTDVSEERAASIFRAENDSILSGRRISSETSMNFCHAKRQHIPDDRILRTNSHQKIGSLCNISPIILCCTFCSPVSQPGKMEQCSHAAYYECVLYYTAKIKLPSRENSQE